VKGSHAVKNTSAARRSTNLAARYVGVLRAPRQTLAEVAREPRWAAMLALLVTLVTVPAFVFLSTARGELAALDTIVGRLESLGVAVDDARYSRLTAAIPSFRWLAGSAALVGLPLLALGAAGAIHAAFRAAGDRSTGFVPILAMVVHSGVILSFGRLVALPFNVLNESMSMPTSLGAMLPMLEETSLLATFLHGIDLFTVWWLVVLALGVGVLYPAPARRIAAGLIGGYVVIVLALAISVTLLRIP
jgi:hypothetical protein